MKMDAETTGTYLAALRKAKGLTQQEAAEALNLSNKTISKWESGAGLPDITVLLALAELYGVSADDILAGETLDHERGAPEKVAERKKYALQRSLTKYYIFAVLSGACAVLCGPMNVSYVSITAAIFCPALLVIGRVLARPGIDAADGAVPADTLKRLYRAQFAVLIVWELFLRRLPMMILSDEISVNPGIDYGNASAVISAWSNTFYAVLAVLTGVLLAVFLRRRTGGGAKLMSGWLAALGATALAEFSAWGLRYAALSPYQYQIRSATDATGVYWTRPAKMKLAELQPRYDAAMWIILALGIFAAAALYFLEMKKRKKSAEK
jgi:transcriptional regulator with XRE-family HTH domain